MNKIFDFKSIDKSEKIIRLTWESFRNSIATGKYTFNQPELALHDTYLKVFNDLFQDIDVRRYLSLKISHLISSNARFCRGAKLNSNETISYDRFIPKKEYINEDNRFSPKGYDWLYLTMQSGSPKYTSTYEPMEECCIKECRIRDGDRFSICHFMLNDSFGYKKIVNLTTSDDYSYDFINGNLERFAQELKPKVIRDIFRDGKMADNTKEDFFIECKKWVTYTYSKLMSEQLFKPLDTDNKELIYAPFQCIAQYFISQGFYGIIYKSTVYENAKNMVLFNKAYARPTGTINDFIYKDGALSI